MQLGLVFSAFHCKGKTYLGTDILSLWRFCDSPHRGLGRDTVTISMDQYFGYVLFLRLVKKRVHVSKIFHLISKDIFKDKTR